LKLTIIQLISVHILGLFILSTDLCWIGLSLFESDVSISCFIFPKSISNGMSYIESNLMIAFPADLLDVAERDVLL